MKTIDLEKPIDEMGEDDLRATLAEVMTAHEQNATDFSEMESTVEALEANVEEAKTYFAEKAEMLTHLAADVLTARFSLDELVDMAQKADESIETEAEAEAEAEEAEFSESEEAAESEAAEAEAEAADESLFAERPQKSPAFVADEDSMAQYRESAKERLAHLSGLKLD